MATSTIARLYDAAEDAAQTVRDLQAAGVARDDISLVTNTTDGETNHAGEGAGAGASLGAILGAGAGLLAGFGALAIPGIGPIVAAGWLVATATGAAAGAAAVGLLGLLIGAGMTEDEANVYAEGVRRGGTLISVRVDENRSGEIEALMESHKAVNHLERGQAYRESGWKTFDQQAPPTQPL